MTKIKIYILFVFAVLSTYTFAQQDPLYTQYFTNPLSVNPAYAGSSNSFNILALNRQQWRGFDGAPVTTTISASCPFEKKNLGLGISLLHDVIGPISQTGVYTDYAYHLRISENAKFAFGLKAGFNYYTFNLLTLNANHADDIKILNGNRTMFLPNVGFGMYLYSDRYTFGFSIPKLLQNSLDEENNLLKSLNKEERHFFVTSSALFTLTDGVKVQPSVIARIVSDSPVSVDVSGMFIFADRFWAGATYRMAESFGLIAQFRINKNLKLGYSYDFTSSWLRPYSSGNHEFMLSVDLPVNTRNVLSLLY